MRSGKLKCHVARFVCAFHVFVACLIVSFSGYLKKRWKDMVEDLFIFRVLNWMLTRTEATGVLHPTAADCDQVNRDQTRQKCLGDAKQICSFASGLGRCQAGKPKLAHRARETNVDKIRTWMLQRLSSCRRLSSRGEESLRGRMKNEPWNGSTVECINCSCNARSIPRCVRLRSHSEMKVLKLQDNQKCVSGVREVAENCGTPFVCVGTMCECMTQCPQQCIR